MNCTAEPRLWPATHLDDEYSVAVITLALALLGLRRPRGWRPAAGNEESSRAPAVV